MSLLLISLLGKTRNNNSSGLVDLNSNEIQQVQRNRLWLLTYISLFTSLLAFFILMITLVELEGSTPKRNYQKLVGKIYDDVVYQSRLQGLDWLQIENTLTKGIRLTIPPELVANASLFSSASAQINPRYLPYLQSIVDVLKVLNFQDFNTRHAKLINGIESVGFKVDFIIRIEGHTDSLAMAPTARFRDNIELSTYRAYAMMEWLRIYTGLERKHFAISGYGSFHPLTANPEQAENRRIEIYLVPLVRPKLANPMDVNNAGDVS